MKKYVILWASAAVLAIAGLSSCSNDDESPSVFQVKNVGNSGCKEAGGDSQIDTRGGSYWDNEYIEYKRIGGGYLSLNHVNAVFNCEPGALNIQATLSGNEITIVESEEHAMANCVCPYDLYCEVGPLSSGDYTVVIYKGAIGAGPYARFSFTYKSGLNGRCYIE